MQEEEQEQIKAGRPLNIPTPDHMMEHFEAYRKYAEDNPIVVVDYVGKDGKAVDRKYKRALSMEGFSVYCYVNKITKNLHDYVKNKNEAYGQFSPVCRIIKEIIRNDQIEGGMAGIYNPSITQRLNGLQEKVQSDITANVKLLNIDPIAGTQTDDQPKTDADA